MDDKLEVFIEVSRAQTEAVKEQTIQLQRIQDELRNLNVITDEQKHMLIQINKHFSNGFKSDILGQILRTQNHVADSEDRVLEKISSLVTALKVQWVTVSLGGLPILFYIIKDIAGG